MLRLTTVVLLLVLASQAGAQQTWVITGNNYYGLRDAAVQASAGDILVVQAGTYEPPTISKGLTILCDPGVTVSNPFGIATIIQNLPANQALVMHGGDWWVGHNPASMYVQNCLGPVIMEGVQNSRQMMISSCSAVQLNDCSASDLNCSDSTVVVSGGSVTGGFYGALSIARGAVTINGSAVQQSGYLVDLPAVRVNNATLTITGNGTSITNLGTTSPAIQASGATIRLDPAARISAAGSPISGSFSLQTRTIPAVRATGAPPGSSCQGSTWAQRGDLAYTFISWPVLPVDLRFGRLWVDSGSPVLDWGVVPASGLRSYQTQVPPLPVRGVVVTLQPITLGPNLQLTLGEPASAVLD